MLLVLALVVGILFFNQGTDARSKIAYGVFREQLREGNIAKVEVQGDTLRGEFVTPPPDPEGKTDSDGKTVGLHKRFITTLPSGNVLGSPLDEELLKQLGDNYRATQPTDGTVWFFAANILIVILLFAALWFMFRRARDQVLGGGLMSGFSKSPARRYELGDRPVTFADVAGLQGVKHELEEVVEFLKNPKKFQRLGGRVPKGILLMGPPGTGKTLLGRAVAGEAGVPFFSINGSEFIQMFVGVGASRVRDMFATAKEHSPSILFIDEIDAVGRHRGAGLGGGNDEREQTLNQILSEMDGFAQTESLIVMAATNRPDVLDPALLRPGRFDRHIAVDRPNLQGRLAIFKVHSRDVPLDDDVNLERLAASTVGLTGADIRNLVNEAALWASRNDQKKVNMADFDYARDKVLMGAKREEVLNDQEKRMTAYHESGHALLAWLTPGGDRVHKVSIIPRGRSLGATQLMPDEDRLHIAESELKQRLLFLLGGRAAEKLVFDELSAGAEDDLKKATQIARRMITHWGMSERLGPVAFRDGEEHPFLGREMAEPRRFSEHTARIIDEEVVRILREAFERAEQMLTKHRAKLDTLAGALVKAETLDLDEIAELIGPHSGK
ncbi:MAG: ATP-dependent zinc metalloprotease FtsH [Thermoguttaceae bacterium]|jgi:cell division protease FtsH|nr:ATP-dependent zinc metalloprotease FtsH [Thermoguttaceae bacterium]